MAYGALRARVSGLIAVALLGYAGKPRPTMTRDPEGVIFPGQRAEGLRSPAILSLSVEGY